MSDTREGTPEMRVVDERQSRRSSVCGTPSPDVLEAASALGALRGQDNSLLDKVVGHPLVANSINYVLEKTISSASENVKRERESGDCANEGIKRPKLTPVRKGTVPTGVQEAPAVRIVANHSAPIMPRPLDLRHKATLQSAQQSLQNIKDLSALNLNIESRKKLAMLIKFLKLGNTQLSERIERLIGAVDRHRKDSSETQGKESEPRADINAISSEIVSTVKKIVNVVSKVPAQSFSEPARGKIREALLKLPTNWSNNELHFITGDDLGDDARDLESSSGASDDDSSHSDYEDSKESFEPIPTIRVTNKRMFQKVRRPSITRRLLNSLLEYRQISGQPQMKKWIRNKIRRQVATDSPNGKVLILAQESLDMINKIIRTCNESLDRAESWNVQRQSVHQEELKVKLEGLVPGSVELPPIRTQGKPGQATQHSVQSAPTAMQRRNLPVPVSVSTPTLASSSAPVSSPTLPKQHPATPGPAV